MQIKNEILSRVKPRAGGNSNRDFKKVASDLSHALGMKDKDIADLACISVTTVKRVKSLNPTKAGQEYRPQSETLEAIFRACGMEMNLTPVKIQKRFRNKPKPKKEKTVKDKKGKDDDL